VDTTTPFGSTPCEKHVAIAHDATTPEINFFIETLLPLARCALTKSSNVARSRTLDQRGRNARLPLPADPRDTNGQEFTGGACSRIEFPARAISRTAGRLNKRLTGAGCGAVRIGSQVDWCQLPFDTCVAAHW
jgi:hypothetical protein